MSTIFSNICFNQENILSNIYTIHNGLFSRIFTNYIFIKERKCPIVRCRSQAHNKCIKIRQNLTPHIVNGSMTFIYDDYIKEFRRIFLVVNHLFRCLTFSCRQFCKRSFFRRFIQFFALQNGIHSLYCTDTYLYIAWNI